MPARILKESICSSPTIDALSLDAERFFYRLIVNCDDYGQFDARPAMLRSRLFPLHPEIPDSYILCNISELISKKLIRVYRKAESTCLELLTWEKHQRIRAKYRKYPAFDAATCSEFTAEEIAYLTIDNNTPNKRYDSLLSNASKCQHLPANASNGQHMPADANNCCQLPSNDSKPNSESNVTVNQGIPTTQTPPHYVSPLSIDNNCGHLPSIDNNSRRNPSVIQAKSYNDNNTGKPADIGGHLTANGSNPPRISGNGKNTDDDVGENLREALRLYEENMKRLATPMELENIKQDITEFGLELFLRALKSAVDHGAFNYTYLRRCLENPKSKTPKDKPKPNMAAYVNLVSE